MGKCYIDGKQYTFKKTPTVLETLKATKKDYRRFFACKKNNRLCNLHQKVRNGDRITVLDITIREGYKSYQNSLSFLLSAVVDECFPNKKLIIEHSFYDGFYCKFKERPIRKVDVNKLTTLMQKKIKEKTPFLKIRKSKKEVMKYFISKEKFRKVQLLKNEKGRMIDIYKCGDYIDITFTPLVPDTSYLTLFALHFYRPGFVLRFPHPEKGEKMPPFRDQKKLFCVFEEYERWGEILGVADIVSLNNRIEKGEISDLIKITEALHEKKIAQIADEIKQKDSKLKIVLIAGPSASGKTTFSKRLAIQLRVNCLSPLTISIDNYFHERAQTPRLPDGTFDFESINAIDVKLLNKHLILLLRDKEVEIPKFDFTTGKRLVSRRIKMHKNQILLIEGIHGLNEKLTHQIPKENKFKLYISALTQLNIDNDHRISTRDTRILRRMVRDNLYRKHSARETFRLWKNVEKEEGKNIFPFQEEADVMFNSALVYELSVLKKFAVPLLRGVTPEQKEFSSSERLLKFLSFFIEIPPTEVPPTSILREFIGGSSFLY